MLRQAVNEVELEGILSEIDIKETSYQKDGKDVNALSGTLKVRVNQTINGEEKELEIPVSMFATEYKTNGDPNPAYKSLQSIKDEFVSIAACGDVDKADRVRFGAAQIAMNEYWSNDRLISFPRIRAPFCSKITKDKCNPKAQFTLEFVIGSKNEEINNDEATGRYIVKAIVPQYGGKVDIIPLVGVAPGVIDVMESYWNEGDTVKALGKLDFSYETRTIVEEVEFGEPSTTQKTFTISDLIVTGGNKNPYDEERAFNADEIKKALAERKNRLDEQKDRDMSRAKTKKAPATAKSTGFSSDDLGF